MRVILTNHAVMRAKQRCNMNVAAARRDAREAILSSEIGNADGRVVVRGKIANWVVMRNRGGYIVITCKGFALRSHRLTFREWLTGRRGAKRRR